MSQSICVLGAGSWGTALAILLARNGLNTTLWGHNPEHVTALATARSNQRYLPDIPFPDNLTVRGNLHDTIHLQQTILISVPSHAFRPLLETIAPSLKPNPRITWATKGLDPGLHCLLHEVVLQTLPSSTPMAIMSGPTFATELAAGLPTAITVASSNSQFAAELATMLHNPNFRAYTSDDIIGVEVGGAVKNVLAIATGVADGLGYGANTRAALVTRGLAEMMRLGLALGGKQETFMGLAGMGDLVLTCTDNQSRNRRLGLSIGKGETLETALQEIGQEVEGISTAQHIHRIAHKHGIDMPISEQVYNILYQQLPPETAVNNLLTRKLKAETT